MMKKIMYFALVPLLVGCTDLAEPTITTLQETLSVTAAVVLGDAAALELGKCKPSYEPSYDARNDHYDPNTTTGDGTGVRGNRYHVICDWPVVLDAGKPSDYYLKTGVVAYGNVVHTIHWFIHGGLAEYAYTGIGYTCWEKGSDVGGTWYFAVNWHNDDYCETEVLGDVVLELYAGWPDCPEVDASNSLREIRPGKRGRGFGARAHARVC